MVESFPLRSTARDTPLSVRRRFLNPTAHLIHLSDSLPHDSFSSFLHCTEPQNHSSLLTQPPLTQKLSRARSCLSQPLTSIASSLKIAVTEPRRNCPHGCNHQSYQCEDSLQQSPRLFLLHTYVYPFSSKPSTTQERCFPFIHAKLHNCALWIPWRNEKET